uniref:DUF7642 domain-containing protein n=1 Tax=Cajanus cajan TaxID=3821 RepID=A0A151TY60_CAJCA|nr:hypothetical protein KK1_011277 [Cajanus cajan]
MPPSKHAQSPHLQYLGGRRLPQLPLHHLPLVPPLAPASERLSSSSTATTASLSSVNTRSRPSKPKEPAPPKNLPPMDPTNESSASRLSFLNRLAQVLRLVPPPVVLVVVEMNAASMDYSCYEARAVFVFWSAQEREALFLHFVADVVVEQGYLQSLFNVYSLRIENVGVRRPPSDDVKIQGVANPNAFRKAVMMCLSNMRNEIFSRQASTLEDVPHNLMVSHSPCSAIWVGNKSFYIFILFVCLFSCCLSFLFRYLKVL